VHHESTQAQLEYGGSEGGGEGMVQFIQHGKRPGNHSKPKKVYYSRVGTVIGRQLTSLMHEAADSLTSVWTIAPTAEGMQCNEGGPGVPSNWGG
jgi:hypothetical protein